MRSLTLTAYELEPGQKVMQINDKEFAIHPTVIAAAWFKDELVLRLMMEMGEVSMHLSPDTMVTVEHPEQEPVFEYEDWFFEDPYDQFDGDLL